MFVLIHSRIMKIRSNKKAQHMPDTTSLKSIALYNSKHNYQKYKVHNHASTDTHTQHKHTRVMRAYIAINAQGTFK